MIAYLHDVQRRRALLVERSAAQRAALADAASPFARKLAALDRFVGGIRAHPVLSGVVAGVVAFLGPQRLLFWSARAAALVSLWRHG